MPHAVPEEFEEPLTAALKAAITEEVANFRRILWGTYGEHVAANIDKLYPDWNPATVNRLAVKIAHGALQALDYPGAPPPEAVFGAAYDEAVEQLRHPTNPGR